MMTSSNGNIFRVAGYLCGEFTGPRWIPRTKAMTRSFDVSFDLRLNKRLRKQSCGWWFETLPRPLWRHSNGIELLQYRSLDYNWLNFVPSGPINNISASIWTNDGLVYLRNW